MIRVLTPSLKFALQEIKLSVSGSLLGFLWVIVNPLILVSVYLFLFQYVMRVRFAFEMPIDYGVFLLSGIVMWVSFANALSKSVNSIIDYRHIVKKVNISPAVFVLSSGISTFLVNSIMFLFLAAVCIIKYPYQSYAHLFASLLFTVACLLLFSIGMSLALASLNVYVRDVSHVLSHVLNFAFYFTPILYTIDKAPEIIQKLLMFNPMTYFAKAMHSAVISGKIELWNAISVLGLSLVSFAVGFLTYKALKEGFYDVL